MLADLAQRRAAVEAVGPSASTAISVIARGSLAGSAGFSSLTATMIRSAVCPLVMKVLVASMTYSSPSRRARPVIARTSLPAPGSVIAIAPISVPATIDGSQRRRCSSLPYLRM